MGGSLPAAFSWDAATLVNGATLSAESPPTIASSVAQWGYCLVIPRAQRREDGGPEILTVRVRVLEGSLGVGLLDAAGTSFLDSIDDIAPNWTGDLAFLIDDIGAVGSVVVRTTGTGAVAFEWLGAESTRLTGAEDVADRPAPLLEPVVGWDSYYGREARTADELIRQFQFDRLREPYIMQWSDGLRLIIAPDEEASRAVFVSGVYEPASTLVLRRLVLRGSTFIDVGAHVGLYTLVASRWVGENGHVYSFEPSSREITALNRNIELNGLANVTVTKAALHERGGTAVLHVADSHHGGQNTLADSFAYGSVRQATEESVTLIALDELWRRGEIRRPGVIKIDAEGSELHVLRGAAALLREARPAVVFEVNQALLMASGTSADEVDQFFRRLNYSVYRLDDDTSDLVAFTRMADMASANFVAFPARAAVPVGPG